MIIPEAARRLIQVDLNISDRESFRVLSDSMQFGRLTYPTDVVDADEILDKFAMDALSPARVHQCLLDWSE